MHPALPPQLRSAARRLAQQPSKSIQHSVRREFHQSLSLRASEPPRDGEGTSEESAKSPIAGGLPEIEELPKNLQKNVKLKELYADLTSKRADIQRLLKGQGVTTSRENDIEVCSAPVADEAPSKPLEVKSPFHGSGLRRRLRANASRVVQKTGERKAPPWLLQWNVHLAGEFDYPLDSVMGRIMSTPDVDGPPDSAELFAETDG